MKVMNIVTSTSSDEVGMSSRDELFILLFGWSNINILAAAQLLYKCTEYIYDNWLKIIIQWYCNPSLFSLLLVNLFRVESSLAILSSILLVQLGKVGGSWGLLTGLPQSSISS